MSQLVIQRLTSVFGEAIVEHHAMHGDETVVVTPERWHDVCAYLRQDAAMAFDMFVDLCGVDYPQRLPRMEVVLHLYSTTRRHRIRVKTRVGDEEMNGAELDSLSDLWLGANWFERETYDMSGVRFRNHPDLRRILMYPEFEGHPLRKDYPAERTQPLVEYRTEAEAGLVLDKLAPFGADEGMSFGRNDWIASIDRERLPEGGLVPPASATVPSPSALALSEGQPGAGSAASAEGSVKQGS
jgi:NADH-quinone oxidoreductase subunit C